MWSLHTSHKFWVGFDPFNLKEQKYMYVLVKYYAQKL